MTKLVRLNVSWGFDVVGKVMRKRGMLTTDDPSAGDRLVIDNTIL
jgi:hypothetical protein